MAKRALRAKDVLPFSVVSTMGVAGSPSVTGILRKGGPAPLWLQVKQAGPGYAFRLPPDALVHVRQTPLTLAMGFMKARHGKTWAQEQEP